MPNYSQRAIVLFSWFLIGCLSAHAQARRELANRLPASDAFGVLRGALERVAEAAVVAPALQEPSSEVGCSAPDAAEEPCPMRILFHGYARPPRTTGIGTVDSHGLSAITEVLPFGNTELSHDGQFVAYDTCIASDRAIYVVNLETSERRKVTPIGPSPYCADVRWSPDDRMLSYSISGDYALNVVSVDGAKRVRLPTTDLAGWQSWSPSGEEIVYDSGRGGSRSLRIIDLRGRARDLTRYGDLNSCDTWAPDWSPDGTRISFTACYRLYTISPQGTDVQELSPDAYSPRWSVDGQWIFFLGKGGLMWVRRDGKFLSKVAEIPPPYPGASPFSLGMVR